MRDYVSTFKSRTEQRTFKVEHIAQNNDVLFAWWDAKITFNEGISFGAITSAEPFTAELKGVCRFRINSQGLFTELDVFHETTTVVQLARQTNNETLAV